MLKSQLRLHNNATVVEMSHFPEMGLNIICPTLVALLEPSEGQVAARQSEDPFHQVIMIDQDSDDVPEKVEQYMRAVLPHFIEREPSKFMRKTLETATQQLQENDDELLGKALELWGLVESIDRERQWSILEKPGGKDEEPRWIKEVQSETDADIYTMICMQLNAAAERKANSTSRNLLSLMHRLLQDSKVKIGFNMFLTALIFLNCVEKSTWAFKAWEQDHLRPGWPLERDPGVFTQQGDNLAGLLKMLLGIRKALPQTSRSAEGKLATDDPNPLVLTYFQSIDLDCKLCLCSELKALLTCHSRYHPDASAGLTVLARRFALTGTYVLFPAPSASPGLMDADLKLALRTNWAKAAFLTINNAS